MAETIRENDRRTQTEVTNQSHGGETSHVANQQNTNQPAYPLVKYDLASAKADMQSITITGLPPYDFSEVENSFIADECFGLKLLLLNGRRSTMNNRINDEYRMVISYTLQSSSMAPKVKPSTDLKITFMVSYGEDFEPRDLILGQPYDTPATLAILSYELQIFARELQDALKERYLKSLETRTEPDYFSIGKVRNRGGKIKDIVLSPPNYAVMMKGLGISEKNIRLLLENVQKNQTETKRLLARLE